MQLTGENFIGSRRSARGSDVFRGMDPAKAAALEPAYHEATEAEIDEAAKLAEAAFEEYRHRSAKERSAQA